VDDTPGPRSWQASRHPGLLDLPGHEDRPPCWSQRSTHGARTLGRGTGPARCWRRGLPRSARPPWRRPAPLPRPATRARDTRTRSGRPQRALPDPPAVTTACPQPGSAPAYRPPSRATSWTADVPRAARVLGPT